MSGRAKGNEELIGRILPWLDDSVCTFATVGTAALQTVLAINNPAASGRIVTLRRLVASSAKAALGQRRIQVRWAPALATVGTNLRTAGTVRPDRTSQTATTYVPLGATASDGGVATAITNPAGLVRVFSSADIGTAAGSDPWELDGIDKSLEPGESFVVEVDLAATDNVIMAAFITEKLGLG